MYRVINFIKRPEYKDWEGAIIEEISTGKRYITNGFYKWGAQESKLASCVVVGSIDMNRFMARWNTNFFNGKIVLE